MARPVASCVRLDQIPETYRDAALLGRGATSLVLARGRDGVMMLTRDAMKRDWLVHGLGIGKQVECFYTSGHHIRGMDDLPVYAIELPRLSRPIGAAAGEARRTVERFSLTYGKVLGLAQGNKGREWVVSTLATYYGWEDGEGGIVGELVRWLTNYDAEQFHFDMSLGNILQDGVGKLVLSDPIVSSNLIDLVHEHKASLGKQDVSYQLATPF